MILAQLTEEIVNELSTINKRDLAWRLALQQNILYLKFLVKKKEI